MGLIRKLSSVSTLGAVKYTSRREAETKERIANARLANAQAEQVRGQNQPDTSDRPWWRQPTIGQAINARRQA